jgi:hypothetical protein
LWGGQSWLQPAFSRPSSPATSVSAARDAPEGVVRHSRACAARSAAHRAFRIDGRSARAFCAARGRTLAFIETAADLRAWKVAHPFFGPVSGYEFAVMMASHSLRHATQIREIREQIE